MKEIYFYGAGKYGTKALKCFLNEKEISYNFKGFIDTNRSIGEEHEGYKILPLSYVPKMATILITVAATNQIVKIYQLLSKAGYSNIYVFCDVRIANRGDFLLDYAESTADWGDCVLPQAEMHVADWCNLNCRGCTHFSPIFEHDFPDIKSRIEDVEKLRSKFTHIVRFYLLGGEPFLNPEIGEYIFQCRKILPTSQIAIVTNGLLIPKLDDEVFNIIKENNVLVSISEYKPTHLQIEKIETRLQAQGVRYEIRSYNRKQVFNRPLSLSDNSRFGQLCISPICTNIWNGKIARCPTLMYIDKFNEKYGTQLPNTGVIELDSDISGKELLDLLQKQVPLCKHCIENPIQWSACGLHPELSDFAVED